MGRNKVICFILIIITASTMLSGCFDAREIDDLGFAIALGLDKGKTNSLRMTFQIAKPNGGGSSGESNSSGGGEKPYSQITIEAPTIYSGLNIVNTFTSKQINMSHIKVVVFSAELAREGLSPYIHAMLRGREFRPNTNIVVARESAEEYLENAEPELVLNLSKYYDLVFEGYRFTAFFPNVEFHDFYNYSESLSQSPVAILGGVGKFESSEDFNIDDSTYKDHDRNVPFAGDFFAGDVPQTGGVKSENMGLAVFDGDRMVGEMDGTEAKMYLLCTGYYNHANWTIPDPKAENRYVLLDIQQSRMPQKEVKFVDGNPEVYLKLNLEGDYLAIQSTIDYEKEGLLELLEAHVENVIKHELLLFLERTREFKSDICGFGNQAKLHFLTWKEWEAFKWKSRYQDATFTVDVSFKARRPGLILKSDPSISSEGKEDE